MRIAFYTEISDLQSRAVEKLADKLVAHREILFTRKATETLMYLY